MRPDRLNLSLAFVHVCIYQTVSLMVTALSKAINLKIKVISQAIDKHVISSKRQLQAASWLF